MIFTSPDAVTWTPQTSGTTNRLTAVKWSGSSFAAVGEGGIALTSPDGTTWTTTRQPDGNYSTAWSGPAAEFVAVGDSGTALTSPDGTTWTAQTTDTIDSLFSIAADDNGTIARSAKTARS